MNSKRMCGMNTVSVYVEKLGFLLIVSVIWNLKF